MVSLAAHAIFQTGEVELREYFTQVNKFMVTKVPGNIGGRRALSREGLGLRGGGVVPLVISETSPCF